MVGMLVVQHGSHDMESSAYLGIRRIRPGRVKGQLFPLLGGMGMSTRREAGILWIMEWTHRSTITSPV